MLVKAYIADALFAALRHLCQMKTERGLALVERIRALRGAKDIRSDRQLTQMAGVSESAIRNIQDGHEPRAEILARLAEPLGVTADDLLRDLPADQRMDEKPKGIPSNLLVLTKENQIPELVGEKDLKVYASAQGGTDGMLITYDVIEHVKRPAPLLSVKDGFAIYAVQDSMLPKYKTGDTLLVHPTRPPRQGDFVLVIRTNDDITHSAMVKQLVSRSDQRVVLKQFNPPETIEIPSGEVQHIYLIVGSYEAR